MRQYIGSLRGLARLNLRSPWLLLLGLLVGGTQLVAIIGFARLPVTPTKVGVVDGARNQVSAALISSLRSASEVHLTTTSSKAAATDLDRNKIDVEVVIPPDLGVRPGAPVVFLYQLQSTGERSLPELRSLVGAFNDREGSLKPVAQMVARPSSQRSLGILDQILPGVLTIVVVASATVAISQFTQFRQKGVFRRIQATGIQPAPFVLAFCTILFLVGMAQALGMTAAANVFYPLHVDFAPLMALTALGFLVNIALGLVVGGWLRAAGAAQVVSQLIFMQIFIAYIPADTRPKLLSYLPAGLLADGFHQSVIGSGTVSFGAAVLGLAVWAAVLLALSTRAFRWDEV